MLIIIVITIVMKTRKYFFIINFDNQKMGIKTLNVTETEIRIRLDFTSGNW